MKNIDILIWGCNDFSKRLSHFLKGSRANIVAFIEDDASLETFCGKEVLSPDALLKRAGFAELPIVIASPHNTINKISLVNFESVRQFKNKMQKIIATYKVNNLLLHPVALIDFLQITYKNKCVTYGLQGSGNTIYNHILNHITHPAHFVPKVWGKIKSVLPWVSAPVFFEKMCYEYTQIIQQVICDVIYQINGDRVHCAPWKTSASHFNCLTPNNQIMSVFSFPTRDHIVNRSYGYHQLPTLETLALLNSREFNLFFVIRNPLEMILSILNKEGCLNKATKQIDHSKFANTSLWVINVLKRWLPLLHKVQILRYESLVNDPIVQINKLISMLGKAAANKNAKKIWDQVGFKRLPGATIENFWQGGNNKWETYFTKEYLVFLKFHGIEDILQKYGYPDILAKFKVHTADISEKFQKEISDNFLINYVEDTHGFDDDNSLEVLKQVYGHKNCIELEHMLLGSVDFNFVEKAAKAFDSNFIKKISLCGAHPDHRVS